MGQSMYFSARGNCSCELPIGRALVDSVDLEPRYERGHGKLSQLVANAAGLHYLAGRRLGEACLAASEEHGWMHGRDHRAATASEHAPCFAEKCGDITQVLQNESADHDVECAP